jgi:hypothetical protein
MNPLVCACTVQTAHVCEFIGVFNIMVMRNMSLVQYGVSSVGLTKVNAKLVAGRYTQGKGKCIYTVLEVEKKR